jgi:acyl dehydratase
MSEPICRGEAIPPRPFGPFDAAAVAAYALASGDDNPLHVDPAIAAKAGLARPPVHGMLLMGCIEPYLAAWRPGARIQKLSGKFIKPVLVGETIEISGKVVQAADDKPAVLRLMIRRADGEIACLAETFVSAAAET